MSCGLNALARQSRQPLPLMLSSVPLDPPIRVRVEHGPGDFLFAQAVERVDLGGQPHSFLVQWPGGRRQRFEAAAISPCLRQVVLDIPPHPASRLPWPAALFDDIRPENDA